MRLGERAAEHGKIFGEHKRLAAVDGAPAGDDAVARHLCLLHAEFGGAVLDEHVELLERALVEQQLDALARGEFSAGVLRLDACLSAAEFCARATRFQGVQDVLHLLPPVSVTMSPSGTDPRPKFGGFLTRPFPNRKQGCCPARRSGTVR